MKLKRGGTKGNGNYESKKLYQGKKDKTGAALWDGGKMDVVGEYKDRKRLLGHYHRQETMGEKKRLFRGVFDSYLEFQTN